MSINATQNIHLTFLQDALQEARKCETTPTAFCVGCIIVTYWPTLDGSAIPLSTGYSRELAGNTHAEANALAKARAFSLEELVHATGILHPPSIDQLLKNADVYTTMEPCSIRTSGLAPCADALVEAQVRRCFIGVNEPDDFVTCEGAQKLRNAGIDVVWVKGLEMECLDEARRGHEGY